MKPTEYAERVRAETSHFNRELGESESGLVRTPSVWSEVERVMADNIRAATGKIDGVSFIVSELDRRESPRLLSLGAGSCALELDWIVPAMADPSSCELVCVDLSPDLMEVGKRRAREKGLRFVAEAQDINQLALDPESFDVIVCWASLHHFTRLDHVTSEINHALREDGTFVTMDICSRNGFLLWPETERVIADFWELLPGRYRVAHTISHEPVKVDRYPNVDCAQTGFECICAEDILPALERHLDREHLIFAHALLRRFFDTMFGPNFDLARPFDRAFFNLVRDYDALSLATHTLRPETFFGVYRKRQFPPSEPPSLEQVFGETAGSSA